MDMELLEEAAGLLGSVAEVKSKCLLLKQRCSRMRHRDVDFIIDSKLSINKMRGELARYSKRLREIWLLLEATREQNAISGVVTN
jgi:hypothetical protein